MIIPKCFAWYFAKKGFDFEIPEDNVVTINCAKEEREALKVELQGLLQEKWGEVYEEVKSRWSGEDVRLYNGIGEEFVENPFYVQSFAEGLKAGISMEDSVPVFYGKYGDKWMGDGSAALDRALAALNEAHEDISYNGHICYFWNDRQCGETVEYDIRSDNLEENSEFEIMFDEKVFQILENEIEEFVTEMKEEIMSDISVVGPSEDDWYSDAYPVRFIDYYVKPGCFLVETLADMVLPENRDRLLTLLTEIDWEGLGLDEIDWEGEVLSISDIISEAVEEAG